MSLKSDFSSDESKDFKKTASIKQPIANVKQSESPSLMTSSLSSKLKLSNQTNTIYWFRKALRLHDNPALIHALENSNFVYPVFVLDPWFVKNARVGPNRWRFLYESLHDLNKSLIKKNSRLILLRGQPIEVFKKKFIDWKINLLCFESDTEPYAKQRDEVIRKLANEMNINVVTKCSNTLYDPEVLYTKNGHKTTLTYQSFGALINKIGAPEKPLSESKVKQFEKLIDFEYNEEYELPKSLKEMGVDETKCGTCLYPGGETEALSRLNSKFSNESWIASFEKPNTSPNSLKPSTTVLSPYLKFGCLSSRLFYAKLMEVYQKYKKHSQPPVSLEGQLLWREFFYFVGSYTPNFDRIENNPICRQIKWDNNPEFFEAWRMGRTGFPFIDAIMTQLREEGWIHHLARHAVACFLTRGDLYQSWTKGQEVFEEWLLDADWSLNAANWQWLSCSAFFHQYFRVYSPIAFGKKTDTNGDYIRKYLPVLKNMPAKYIYEPWMAPPSVQKTAKCIIGEDYPMCIVDHNIIHKKNIERMKQAFESGKKIVEDANGVLEKVETEIPKASKITKTENSKESNKNQAKSSSSNITNFFKPKTSPDSQPPKKKAKK